MSRIQVTASALPTGHAAGLVASIFRGTACIEKAFQQEDGGELQHLEECWSDAAVLRFILLGWIGVALKVVLFVLLATLVGACVQGRRPWCVFVSFCKGAKRVVGGVCGCCEVDDGVGETEGVVWQERKEGGGYFGSRKEKVLSCALIRLLSCADFDKGVIRSEEEGRYGVG